MYRDVMIDICKNKNIDFVELKKKERYLTAQSWRESFAQKLKLITGKWSDGGYHWEIFSGNLYPSISGAEAISKYLELEVQNYLILPDDTFYPALMCTSDQLIDLSSYRLDVCVCSVDFTWSMSFGHEPLFGPYFASRK